MRKCIIEKVDLKYKIEVEKLEVSIDKILIVRLSKCFVVFKLKILICKLPTT